MKSCMSSLLSHKFIRKHVASNLNPFSKPEMLLFSIRLESNKENEKHFRKDFYLSFSYNEQEFLWFLWNKMDLDWICGKSINNIDIFFANTVYIIIYKCTWWKNKERWCSKYSVSSSISNTSNNIILYCFF